MTVPNDKEREQCDRGGEYAEEAKEESTPRPDRESEPKPERQPDKEPVRH